MTAEELIALLQQEQPKTELYVCHFAKMGGTAYPRIHPLASLERRDGRLCLVEKDDRGRFLADR